ncbi:unnamed protein product [Clonostachys rosea]|uniref:Prion-inhibition and propagation HeLo domain-containing protein n=1 Tax=Bionectria ochroleuca TaxID=29856 RepID=A0ABY6UJ62_BIOOC|nr:unnamed protein product [Clonostachys rosea]
MVASPETLQAPYELACKYLSQHQDLKYHGEKEIAVRTKLVKQNSRLYTWGRANGFPLVPDFPTLSEFHPLLQDDDVHTQVKDILEKIVYLHLSGPSRFKPGKAEQPLIERLSLKDFIWHRGRLIRKPRKDIEKLNALADELASLITKLKLLSPGSQVSWVKADVNVVDWSLVCSMTKQNSDSMPETIERNIWSILESERL